MKPLLLSQDVFALNRKAAPGEGPVFESDLLPIFKRRKLDSALLKLGRASISVMKRGAKSPASSFGTAEDPSTGLIIPAWHMAYMANIAIISGANDWKQREFTDDELLALVNNLYPAMAEPMMDDPAALDTEEFLIQKHLEQFSWQYFPAYDIARTLILFDEILPSVFLKRKKLFKHDPDFILKTVTGLSITEHLKMAMCVCAQVLDNGALIAPKHLFDTSLAPLKNLLTKDKVLGYFSIISANYAELRTLDSKRNNTVQDPWYTKHRFNPLEEKPLVLLDRKSQEEGDVFYVAPNFQLLTKRTFSGIYWTVHSILEERGEHRHFRAGFGHVFEAYVGRLLKRQVPSTFALEERGYEFFDWIVPDGDGYILVEVKAEQFNLLSKSYPQKDQILHDEILPKIIASLVQCNRRMAEIQKREELSFLRGKKITPCIVVWDVPLVEQGGMQRYVLKSIEKILEIGMSDGMKKILIDKKIEIKEIAELRSRQPTLVSVREIEFLESVSDRVSIRSFLEKKALPGSGGRQILNIEAPGRSLTCPSLDKKYKEYWEGMEGG